MFFPTKSNIMFGRHVSQLNAFVVKQIQKRQDERSRPAFDKKAPPRDILDRFFEGYNDKFDEKTVLQVTQNTPPCAAPTFKSLLRRSFATT
jgi:hypothetical protein